jgi:hypothetical protein
VKSLILGTDSELLRHAGKIKLSLLSDLEERREVHLSNLLKEYGHLLPDQRDLSSKYAGVIDEVKCVIQQNEYLDFDAIEFKASHLEQEFLNNILDCKLPALYTPVLSLRRALSKVIREYLLESFIDHYETLWPMSLREFGWGDIEWQNFLDAQARQLTRSKWVFEFYWKIYKAYSEVYRDCRENPHFVSCFSLDGDYLTEISNEWLFERCLINRIKLKSPLSRRNLIERVEKWSHLILIDNPENFVKTNFSFADSFHSITTYPYTIALQKPARYFLTYFKKECEIGLISKDADENHQDIEVQLWLEFVFRGMKGFSFHSTDKFYLRDQITKNYGKNL